MERLRLNEVVVVEGRYDKIRLQSVLDAIIITTEGFGVFNDREKQRLLRRLAAERGLLVLTDSDAAGFVIRRFLNGCIDSDKIKHAYIPPVAGKEKRKSSPSKEGLLGVEGIDRETLLESLRRAGVRAANNADCPDRAEEITRERLFDDGFIGGRNSAKRRTMLLEALLLPRYMSVNALLQIIGMVTDMGGYEKHVRLIDRKQPRD